MAVMISTNLWQWLADPVHFDRIRPMKKPDLNLSFCQQHTSTQFKKQLDMQHVSFFNLQAGMFVKIRSIWTALICRISGRIPVTKSSLISCYWKMYGQPVASDLKKETPVKFLLSLFNILEEVKAEIKSHLL
jgi:hypothetical protein